MSFSRRIRVLPRFTVACMVSLGVLAVAAPASPSQIPTSSPSDRTLTFPSGLTVTMTEGTEAVTAAEMRANGTNPVWPGMRQNDYFNNLGPFSPSPYTPNGFETSTQPAFYSLTYWGELYPYSRRLPVCPVTQTRGVEMRCQRDELTFTFSRPVTNPVLHINNLGANSYSANNDWDNQRLWMHSSSILTLDVANSTYTGTPNLRLASKAGSLAVVSDGASYLLANSDSRLIGAPAIARTNDTPNDSTAYVGGSFGAGSVVVEGTWTKITFNRDFMWQYDTYNPTNTPGRNYTYQAENECILNQMPASTIYRCSQSGQTWSPNQTLTTRSWDSTLMGTAVLESLQIWNPTPEGVSYLFTVDEDFGTAPASYDETNGASHVISNARIGANASSSGAEVATSSGGVNNSGSSGITSPLAGSTDNHDDAFTSAPKIPTSGDFKTTIPLTGITAPAKLCGWVDLDSSGTFTANERQCASIAANATSAELTWPGSSMATVKTSTWMRLRLSYDQVGVESPTGRVDSGEVEDWQISRQVTQTTTKKSTLPATGKNSHQMLWTAMFALVTGTAVLLLRRKRAVL